MSYKPWQFKKGNIPWNKDKPADEKTKIRLQSYNINRIRSKEAIEKHKETMRKKQNDPSRSKSKTSAHAKRWKESVKIRDNWKCTKCESTHRISAHHIIPWNKNEELRFDINNGITLCVSCHMKLEYKEYPKKGYWKDKKLSEEHKRKMSEAKIGKCHPDNYLRCKGKSWIIDPETGKRKWIDK